MSLKSYDSGEVAVTMQKKEKRVKSNYFSDSVRSQQSRDFMGHMFCKEIRTSGNIRVKIRMFLMIF